jgi:phosphoglycolate phosphatase
MQNKFDLLLFDLDGTLVDSGEGIMKCAQYALAQCGISVDDYHTLRAFVGPPFKDFYGFSHDEAMKAVEAYRDRYFKKGIYEQMLYPGVVEFLHEVKRRGYRMAIATSKTQVQADKVTGELFPALRECFDYIFGRDEEGLLHTKADVINAGLRQLGCTDTSRVLMIGDRKFDIIGAKECGLPSLGVLFGYGSREEFAAAGADMVCNSYDEILSLI